MSTVTSGLVITEHPYLGTMISAAPPAPPQGEAIDAARAEIERLYDREHALVEQYQHADAERADLEANAGASVLDGAKPETLGAKLSAAERTLTLLDHAISEVRRRRVAAIQALWRAEAAELRRQAAEVHRQADERQQRTDALLRELQEWEGTRYTVDRDPPEEARRQADGSIRGAEGFVLPPGGLEWARFTKTEMLRNRASDLEQRAVAIERKQVPAADLISATSRDELLAELAAKGPMQLVPPLHKVYAWLEEGERKEAQRRAGKIEFELQRLPPCVFRLYWRDGGIDMRQSYIGPVRE